MENKATDYLPASLGPADSNLSSRETKHFDTSASRPSPPHPLQERGSRMDADKEKAQHLAIWALNKGDVGYATDIILAALRSVREEERARCAGIARQEFAETPGYSGAGDIIARAIEADPNLQKMQIAPSERAGDRDRNKEPG